MRITVNGDGHEIESGCTVQDLLGRLELQDRPCAVEINQAVVPHRRHADHVIVPDDRVEIVTLVGGG